MAEQGRTTTFGKPDTEALIREHFDIIYWFPKKAMGAEEEDCADFTIFAVEKIKLRKIFDKFEPARGVFFTTWLGVVLRNLYFDFLRVRRRKNDGVTLDENYELSVEGAESFKPSGWTTKMIVFNDAEEGARVILKLLYLPPEFLNAGDVHWIAAESGKTVPEVMKQLAEIERIITEKHADLKEMRDKLAEAYWWKNHYEQLYAHKISICQDDTRKSDEIRRKMRARRKQYDKILSEFHSSRVTLPYQHIAELLNISPSSVGMRISRSKDRLVKRLKQYYHFSKKDREE